MARSVRWQNNQREPTFVETARRTLAPLVNEFVAAAEADLSDIKALHRMRVAGKPVRYAMELLARAFDDSFRGELYATFEEVQEKLGTTNDHATAIATFNEWLQRADSDGTRAEPAELIVNEEKQLNAKCHEFRDWWTAERAMEVAQNFAKVFRSSVS